MIEQRIWPHYYVAYLPVGKIWYIWRVHAVSPAAGVESSGELWDDDAVFQGAGWVN